MAPGRCLTWWDGYFWSEAKERTWFCVAWGDFSPPEGSRLLSPSPFSFSPPLYPPSLAGDGRTVWKQFVFFFLHLRVANVGKGIELCHWSVPFFLWKADTGKNQRPIPNLVPWTLTHVKPNTAVYSVDAGPQHTVVFPSHRGYQVTGMSWQSLLVILALVTTCWPKRDQYSLNKSCLNHTWVSRCC